MTLLAIYGNPSLFWWVILPFGALGGWFVYRTYSRLGHDLNFLDGLSGILLISMVLLGAIFCFDGNKKLLDQDIVNEINEVSTAKEEQYFFVKLLGKRQVIYNPPDNMRYVRMGNGRMIGYKTIFSNAMCRACGQFNDTSRVDSIYVYSATTSNRTWLNEPQLYFSKKPDVVFEEMMDRPVK